MHHHWTEDYIQAKGHIFNIKCEKYSPKNMTCHDDSLHFGSLQANGKWGEGDEKKVVAQTKT